LEARPAFQIGALLFLGVLTGCGSWATKSNPFGTGPASTSVSLSDTSFDFGLVAPGSTATQAVVVVTNMGSTTLAMKPSIAGTAGFAIVAAQSCGTQLAARSSCSIVVSYAPTTTSVPAEQTATLNLNYGNATAGTPATVALTGVSAVISSRLLAAGTVTSTSNPQVALYTITPPAAGTVTVNFGTTTAYGLKTWSVPTPSGGGPVTIEVAGMLANTTYHVQALVQFQDGTAENDIDHTFTTGSLPNVGGATQTFSPNLTVTTPGGMTPQPGIEMLTGAVGKAVGVYATDQSGNIIWTYPFLDEARGSTIDAVKSLANGDFVLETGAAVNAPLLGPISPAVSIFIREIDLIGNTIREITLAQLNAALAANGFTGLVLANFHHELVPLPNGHLLVMADTLKQFTNLPGYPGTTTVLGDVVVDLDPSWKPVWVWNEFDHLDINRHPYMFPDWTHSNAILYSSDDGNIIVSSRHQSWLIKVNYANGTGDGSVIWRLGYQGDFTLMNNGTVDANPADWFYAQHEPNFVGASNAGIFNLVVMDNGDDRQYTGGIFCGTTGAPACYSTVPIFQINESTMTATFTFHQIIPLTLYNSFGGNAEVLGNGDVEYDLCGLPGPNSAVFEVTQNSQAQTVWELQSTGTQLYRAFRVPSLYPGVQW
jgi:arylsulfate sulfotransferase